LSAYDAKQLTNAIETAQYFERVLDAVGIENAKLCANWIMGEVNSNLKLMSGDINLDVCPVTSEQLANLIKRIADNTISNSGAKEVFRTMWTEGGEADAIIEAKGLKQVSDTGAIEALVDGVIAANAEKVAEYRSGKDKLFGFFVGVAMKASQGKANPAQLNEVLKKKLAG
jgi:aspartyl-tRNA(Asn)/glutamyl-tRNA(Gln) amidotransferase subunit B